MAHQTGDVLNVVDQKAQPVKSQIIVSTLQRKTCSSRCRHNLEQLMARAKENENLTEMPILVKADVQGSAEAIVQAMEKIGNDVRVRVLPRCDAITIPMSVWPSMGAPVLGLT